MDDSHLFLYKKGDPEVLRRALPLSYDPSKGSFITVVFVDGCDYLSQMTEDQVRAALATMCPLEESPLRDRYAQFAAYQLNAGAIPPSAMNVCMSWYGEVRWYRIRLLILVAAILLLIWRLG